MYVQTNTKSYGRYKKRRAEDNEMIFELLLSNLSKAFDCFSHELLIAKLHVYCFSFAALRVKHSYLTNRKQKTQIKSSYSSGEKYFSEFPKDLYSAVFLCDMFFLMSQNLPVIMTILHHTSHLVTMMSIKYQKMVLFDYSNGIQISK